LFDPQTSGGLLIAIAEEKADALLRSLHEKGVLDARVIGRATEENRTLIRVER